MKDACRIKVRFMPFQLYPHLPSGASNPGVPKDSVFRELAKARHPEWNPTDEERLAAGSERCKFLCSAWAAEGLTLKSPPTGANPEQGGRMGSSFDSQRLILLARHQGKEDQMIEQVYHANHSDDKYAEARLDLT